MTYRNRKLALNRRRRSFGELATQKSAGTSTWWSSLLVGGFTGVVVGFVEGFVFSANNMDPRLALVAGPALAGAAGYGLTSNVLGTSAAVVSSVPIMYFLLIMLGLRGNT